MATYQTTPLAMDPYSRVMAQAFDDRDYIGNPTGFLSWFGRPGFGETKFSPVASVVDIDIIRGNERTAALIPRGMISKPLGTTQLATTATKYTTFSRRFPIAFENGAISSDQLEFRGAGENPFAGLDHLSRMRRLALEQHKEQVRRMIRLMERLAAQSLLTGVQDATTLGTAVAAEQFDFVRLATHSFAAAGSGGSWAAAASNIMGDIQIACNLIRQDAHVKPDFMLCGQTAINGMLLNTDLLAWAESRRIKLFVVDPQNPMPTKFQRMVDGGWIYRGYVETPDGYQLSVFTYVDTYVNEAGVVTPYMPLTDVLIGSSEARCDRYFGPPERLPLSPNEKEDMRFFMGIDPDAGLMPPNIKGASDVISPAMFYFDGYKSGRHNFAIETQCAPIFAPTMTDAWVTIDAT